MSLNSDQFTKIICALDAVKQAIKDAVTKPEGKLFTEDIKLYLYQAKTDDEINTLVEAIKK